MKEKLWRPHLASALWFCIYKNRLYVLGSTVRESWQKEIVKALKKSYSSVYVVGEAEAIEERSSLLH